MSMNKAIHQVIMHEQIGGNKQAPSQPTKPVKMPEAPAPTGPKAKSTTGVNVPDTGGAEVTPPEGLGENKYLRQVATPKETIISETPENLPESMKAFWKQRIGNQLIERKQVVPTVIKFAKWAIPGIVAGETTTPMMPTAFDPWGVIPDPFVGPGNNPRYDGPGSVEYVAPPLVSRPTQWAGPNVPSGGGVAV